MVVEFKNLEADFIYNATSVESFFTPKLMQENEIISKNRELFMNYTGDLLNKEAIMKRIEKSTMNNYINCLDKIKVVVDNKLSKKVIIDKKTINVKSITQIENGLSIHTESGYDIEMYSFLCSIYDNQKLEFPSHSLVSIVPCGGKSAAIKTAQDTKQNMYYILLDGDVLEDYMKEKDNFEVHRSRYCTTTKKKIGKIGFIDILECREIENSIQLEFWYKYNGQKKIDLSKAIKLRNDYFEEYKFLKLDEECVGCEFKISDLVKCKSFMNQGKGEVDSFHYDTRHLTNNIRQNLLDLSQKSGKLL